MKGFSVNSLPVVDGHVTCQEMTTFETRVADMFRDMLQLGSMKGTDSSHTVHYCHKKGWIYSATADKDELVYVFLSPIHSL